MFNFCLSLMQELKHHMCMLLQTSVTVASGYVIPVRDDFIINVYQVLTSSFKLPHITTQLLMRSLSHEHPLYFHVTNTVITLQKCQLQILFFLPVPYTQMFMSAASYQTMKSHIWDPGHRFHWSCHSLRGEQIM